MIQKRITHCHAWIDAFLQTEEAGSLQQYGSLDKLIAAAPDTATPADIESMQTADEDASSGDADSQE
jgi:hypothetical protein